MTKQEFQEVFEDWWEENIYCNDNDGGLTFRHADTRTTIVIKIRKINIYKVYIDGKKNSIYSTTSDKNLMKWYDPETCWIVNGQWRHKLQGETK